MTKSMALGIASLAVRALAVRTLAVRTLAVRALAATFAAVLGLAFAFAFAIACTKNVADFILFQIAHVFSPSC